MRSFVILTLHHMITMVIRLRRMRYKDYTARIRTTKNAYSISVERSEEKKTFWRPKRRLENSIKTDLNETEVVDWIRLSQDIMKWWDFMNTVMNLRFP
jgi:hypothetical protein